MGIRVDMAKYYPELVIGDAMHNLTANQPQTYENLSRFAKSPGDLILVLRGLKGDLGLNSRVYADVDGIQRKVDVNAIYLNTLTDLDRFHVVAKGNIVIKAISTSDYSNACLSWLVDIRKPTTIEKLLYGIDLNDKDLELIEKYQLTNLISTRTVIKHEEHIIERNVVEEFFDGATTPISAGENPQIGSVVVAPKNRYIVLEGIHVSDATTHNDIYVSIQRDNDVNYVKVRTRSITDAAEEYKFIPLRIPAIDKLSVTVENESDIDNLFLVRYIYSIRPLGIAEKIKWGLQLTPEERAVADEKDMFDKVIAGLV